MADIVPPIQAFDPQEYGFNMNYIQQQILPAISSTYTRLVTSLQNIDPNNPASLLQVQFLLSQYENSVQSGSQMFAAWANLLREIIQNIR